MAAGTTGGKGYATKDGKFIGLPLAAIGNAIVYRDSWVKEAGFSEFPKDTTGFLELCKALQARSAIPPASPHGHGVGDGNNYAHWLLWSHGGKMVDESGKVVDQQPRDDEVASNMRRSSTRPSSRARKAGSTSTTTAPSWPASSSITANGISVYRTAQINKDNDPKLAEIAKDIRTHQPADRPGRQVGRAAPDHHGGDLQVHDLSERGEGLSAVHVREGADGRLDREVARLLLPAAEGLRQQPGLDGRPERRRPIPRPPRRCARTAMPARSATRRPPPWPITCWSTCSPRR